MFTTAAKRGKKGKNPGATAKVQNDDLSTMYAAADFGGGKPDSSRRFTGLYGKNAKARNETDVETGEESRRSGRMFNWMKGDSY